MYAHKGNGRQRYAPMEHSLRLGNEQYYLQVCLEADLAEYDQPASDACRDLEVRIERLGAMMKDFHQMEERTVRRIDGP